MRGGSWMALAVAAALLFPVAGRAQGAETLPERKVSLELYLVPLREALQRLFQGMDVPCTVAANVPNVPVSVTVRDVSLETALRLITRSAASKAPGVGYWQDGNGISIRVGGLIRRPAPAPATAPDLSGLSARLVSLDLQDTPLRRAVDALFGQVGANYMVNPNIPPAPITLHVQELPFDQAMELLTQEAQDQIPTFNIKKVGETYLVRIRGDDVRPLRRPTEEVSIQDPTDSRFMIAKIVLRNESIFTLAQTLGFPTVLTERALFDGRQFGQSGASGAGSQGRSQYYLYPRGQ